MNDVDQNPDQALVEPLNGHPAALWNSAKAE